MIFKCEWTKCEMCGRFIQKKGNKHFHRFFCHHCKEIIYTRPEILKFLNSGNGNKKSRGLISRDIKK